MRSFLFTHSLLLHPDSVTGRFAPPHPEPRASLSRVGCVRPQVLPALQISTRASGPAHFFSRNTSVTICPASCKLPLPASFSSHTVLQHLNPLTSPLLNSVASRNLSRSISELNQDPYNSYVLRCGSTTTCRAHFLLQTVAFSIGR